MGAIGDPRADVGYLLATYTEPNGRASALGLVSRHGRSRLPDDARSSSPATSERSGRDVQPLAVVRSARALEGGRVL